MVVRRNAIALGEGRDNPGGDQSMNRDAQGNTRMPTCEDFVVDCPTRLLFDQIAHKWSMMVLTVLENGPVRFSVIKRHLEGVTQKALTQCLRRLERNGLVSRRVVTGSPVGVEYAITPLGRTLQTHLRALYAWTLQNLDAVEDARRIFEAKSSAALGWAQLSASKDGAPRALNERRQSDLR